MSRKKFRLPPFVPLRRDLMKDPVWRKLSSSAKIAYVYLRGKFHPQNTEINEVSLTYSEMKDMMSSKTLSRAFKELQETGFIEKTKDGGMFGGACRYKFIGAFKDFYVRGYRV